MRTLFAAFFAGILLVFNATAQTTPGDSVWTLKLCIDYALLNNIQIQQGSLNSEINRINTEQVKAERFPSINASAGINLNWNKQLDLTTMEYSEYSGSDNTNLGVNASVILFNGFRVSNTIKQKNTNYQAGQMDLETTRENISLNVLEAYLQVLYSMEQVKNSQNQVLATTEQLRLADERMQLGAITKLDHMQVKSQLAGEKSTLASAENNLAINRLTLMQLMQLPGYDGFIIDTSEIDLPLMLALKPEPDSIYKEALSNKPQIKSALLNEKSAQLAVDIAQAGYLPKLILDGGLNTGYTSKYTQLAFNTQFQNELTPSVGVTLSIPIYQNRSIKSNVNIARVQRNSAMLNTLDTKDKLRKSVKQACLDVNAAEKQFELGTEEYNTANEAYLMASEKFNLGLMSSIDFFVQKTKMIVAENNLLQAKYNLIFSYKTLDYYAGKPLAY